MSPGEEARKFSFDKGAFYRTSRMLHAYLSAFAFIALIFFSITGVLLNHPEWFDAYKPTEGEVTLVLPGADLAKAMTAPAPAKALARAVQAQGRLPGAFSSGDVDGQQAIIRLDGPKGTSDVTVDLATGRVQARTTRASFNSLMMDLHRGKNSGGPWRFVIDATAWIVFAMALIGYILFFSLRFRLKTSLVLTGLSLAALLGVALLMVP